MKKGKLITLLTATTIILSSCGSDEKNTQQPEAIPVTIEHAVPTQQTTEHQFSGKVTADDKMVLSTTIIGQIEQVLIKEGDEIVKGQLLVKVKSNDLSAKRSTAISAVKTAKLNMKNTIKNYQRIKTLFEKESATQKELEDMATAKEGTITKYKEANQNLTEINEYLSYANLKSPINGFVSKKMVNVGDMAKPGHPILALESLDELKIEVDVPEFEISKFKLNDAVSITIDAVNLNKVKGTVERIIPSSSFSGQYKVIVVLKESYYNLKPGMYTKIHLLKGMENKLLVSKNIIINRGQLTGLYTVNQQDEAVLRWVRLGKEYGDKVEVLSGLRLGEQLIVSSASKLTDGIKIQITKIN
ncbi:MAG: hypothetical protein COA97_05195 [Flavobacteriales bacterium]|nr:MAG: hypothetical protein COA97_05195 [Flavobacteriales bacterium]